MEEIKIDLTPNDEEFYEVNDNNILKVRIQLPTGEMIDEAGYRVEIRLSKDAMLGLGINLIRAAYSEESNTNFWHLYPSEFGNAVQNLGVYLHPSSCQLLVSENEFEILEKELKIESK